MQTTRYPWLPPGYVAKGWAESKHPRDRGKFSSQPGSHGGAPTDRKNEALDAAFAEEPAKPNPAPQGDQRVNPDLDRFMGLGAEPDDEPQRYPSRHNPGVTYGHESDRDSDDAHFDRQIAAAQAEVQQIKRQIAKLEKRGPKGRKVNPKIVENLKAKLGAATEKAQTLKAKAEAAKRRAGNKLPGLRTDLAASQERGRAANAELAAARRGSFNPRGVAPKPAPVAAPQPVSQPAANQPGGQPHVRTEQAAVSAAKAVRQAAQSGGDVRAAHQQAVAALDAHAQEGERALDRMAAEKYGPGPRAQQAAAKAKQIFAQKVATVRAKLDQMAGANGPKRAKTGRPAPQQAKPDRIPPRPKVPSRPGRSTGHREIEDMDRRHRQMIAQGRRGNPTSLGRKIARLLSQMDHRDRAAVHRRYGLPSNASPERMGRAWLRWHQDNPGRKRKAFDPARYPWLVTKKHDVSDEKRDETGEWTAGVASRKDKPLHEMTRAKVRADAPDKPPPTEENLEDIADALRQAMDEAVGSPKDQCIATAYALKTLYPEAEIWEGTVGGESHTLAKLGGKFLDVTADQFGGWDEVQVLDPDDLPKAYKRFRNITGEHDPSKSQWKTQAAITDALRATLRESSESSAQSAHVYAVHDAKKAGKPIPKDVLADFPDLSVAKSFTAACYPWLVTKAKGEAGRWITIGGTKGKDGKRHGGSPVYIENGRITKGHPSLVGKDPGRLDAPAEDSPAKKRDKPKGERRWHVTPHGEKIGRSGFKAGGGGGIGGPVSGKGVSVWKTEEMADRFLRDTQRLEDVRSHDSPLEQAELAAGMPISATDAIARGHAKRLGRELTDRERAVVHAQAALSPYIPADSFFHDQPKRKWEKLAVRVADGGKSKIDNEAEELYDPEHVSLEAADKPATKRQEVATRAAQSRKDNASSSEYAKTVWRKKARQAGHDPKHLEHLAGDIKAHHDAFAGERKDVHRYAREHSKKNFGADLRNVGANARHGSKDHTSIRGFDETTESTVNAYPHHFHDEDGEHGSHSDQLHAMLSGGDPAPMEWDDAYGQALDQMGEAPTRPRGKKPKAADDSFDFGENAIPKSLGDLSVTKSFTVAAYPWLPNSPHHVRQ